MNQQDPKKRTLIAFGLALVTSLMSIYIQNYVETKGSKNQNIELKASSTEEAHRVESFN